ncbi:hypothetical protein [Brasilonema sp. UFV-L1]|nr:hypothetical protein [Brasilonema sp. UFV-L1]
MDTLDGTELIIFIEEDFDINIPDEYHNVMTLQQVVDLILKLGNTHS